MLQNTNLIHSEQYYNSYMSSVTIPNTPSVRFPVRQVLCEVEEI